MLYQQFMRVRHDYSQRLKQFYQDGQAAGCFSATLLPQLMVLQDQQIIPAMLTRVLTEQWSNGGGADYRLL